MNQPKPDISPSAVVLPGAVVVGNVHIGPDCGIWYNAVLRGDTGPITIGRGTNIQDGCIIHHDGAGMAVGEGVTVGHGCILHGCTIGDNCLIGMGSLLMDGAVVGQNSLIGAGSLITAGTVIPEGVLAFGRPAKVVRPLTAEEIEHNRISAQNYMLAAEQARAALG